MTLANVLFVLVLVSAFATLGTLFAGLISMSRNQDGSIDGSRNRGGRRLRGCKGSRGQKLRLGRQLRRRLGLCKQDELRRRRRVRAAAGAQQRINGTRVRPVGVSTHEQCVI